MNLKRIIKQITYILGFSIPVFYVFFILILDEDGPFNYLIQNFNKPFKFEFLLAIVLVYFIITYSIKWILYHVKGLKFKNNKEI